MLSIRRSAIALAIILAGASQAWAHAHPKVMAPAAESSVPSPAKIIVTFTEPVEAKFSSLTLADDKGAAVSKDHSKGDPKDPKTLTLAVPQLSPGGYHVHWVSVAPDGHRMEGSYKFRVIK